MSYILDALKKSEAERKKAQPKGRARLALADEAQARPPYGAWAGIGFALAALLLAGAYLLGQRQAPAPPVAKPAPQAPAQPAPEPQATVVTAAVEAEPARPAQPASAAPETGSAARPLAEPAVAAPGAASEPRLEARPAPPAKAPRAEAPEAPQAEAPAEPPAPQRSILRFADLPSRLQAKVPDLKVSSHLYSSDPGDRMATINGTPRREGADLGGGLKLVEVTASGVLLEIEGRLFALDILEEWNRETR